MTYRAFINYTLGRQRYNNQEIMKGTWFIRNTDDGHTTIFDSLLHMIEHGNQEVVNELCHNLFPKEIYFYFYIVDITDVEKLRGSKFRQRIDLGEWKVEGERGKEGEGEHLRDFLARRKK